VVDLLSKSLKLRKLENHVSIPHYISEYLERRQGGRLRRGGLERLERGCLSKEDGQKVRVLGPAP
jgi:hypothetical protein